MILGMASTDYTDISEVSFNKVKALFSKYCGCREISSTPLVCCISNVTKQDPCQSQTQPSRVLQMENTGAILARRSAKDQDSSS